MTEGIEGVSVGGEKLPFLELGVYPELEVERVSTGTSFSGDEFFKIQVKVIASNGGAPVGSSRVQIITKDKFNYYKKDIKRFTMALLNKTEDKITGKIVDELLTPENPARGAKIAAEVLPNEKNPKYARIVWKAFEVPAHMAATATTKPATKTATK